MMPTDPLFRRIMVSIKNGWLTLTVTGDGSASYPLTGSDLERENEIDRFAQSLKDILKGGKLKG